MRNGAIDFIEKSRSLSIIRQRVHVAINGTAGPSRSDPATERPEFMRCGRLALRLDSHSALFDGVPVALGITEFHIVRLPASVPDRECSHRQIHDVICSSGFGSDKHGQRGNVPLLLGALRRWRRGDAQGSSIGTRERPVISNCKAAIGMTASNCAVAISVA